MGHADSYRCRWSDGTPSGLVPRLAKIRLRTYAETLFFTSADWSHNTWLGSELERENGLASDRRWENGRRPAIQQGVAAMTYGPNNFLSNGGFFIGGGLNRSFCASQTTRKRCLYIPPVSKLLWYNNLLKGVVNNNQYVGIGIKADSRDRS
jgi:hypothetical protein